MFNDFIDLFQVHMVIGYSGYFVLGYLLNSTEIYHKHRRVLYIFGTIGLIYTIGLTSVLSIRNQTAGGFLYSNFDIGVLLFSISVFVFAKNNSDKTDMSSKRHNSLLFLSKCSFGVYLLHPFFIEVLEQKNITSMSFTPLLSIPVLSVIVFLLSLFVSALINKIPLVNKWIV